MKKAQRILAALIALPLLLTVLTGCELFGALEIKMGLHEHEEFVDGDYRCCCLSKTFNVVGCLIAEYVGEDKEEIVIPKTIGGHPVMIIGRIGALDPIFSNCSSLKSVTIPETVESISYSAFNGCDSLTELKVDENNKTFHSDGNCIIETATNTLVVGCAGSIIPDYVTAIGNPAFMGCTSLTSITIPDSVTKIEDVAFRGCESLAEINYNGTMAEWKAIYIGDRPFFGVKANVVHCTDGDVDIPRY